MKKDKEQKIKILLGLLIIPIIFILSITAMGMVSSIIKDSNFVFDLLNYWTISFKLWYLWVLSLLLSVIMYLFYLYKINISKVKEASLKETKQKDYGSAAWLTKKEVNQLYSLVSIENNHNQHGFVVNSKLVKNKVFHNIRSNTHSLVIGGTGSGKTQGLVLPTININARSQVKPSMIITDVKGELYQAQGKLLEEQDYYVQVLNLRNIEESIRWNPLQQIYNQFELMLLSHNEQEKLKLKVLIQSDIQDLSKTLFTSKNQTDPFWNDSGALITEAIILGILEKTKMLINKHKTKDNKLIKLLLKAYLPINKFNLASVAVIASLGKDMSEWFKSFPDQNIAKITANQVLHSGTKTLTSILMTMSTNLAIFKNDFIRNLTCLNDLNFNDFIRKPTVLFIVVPDENHNYYVFISLLISQIYKFLVREASKNNSNKLTRPVYFLCDEFGNLPEIPNIESMITIARSRNIFFQLILQDLQQLKNKYGNEKANIIFTNCSLHIFLQTMDLETAERYSKMIGQKTIVQVSINQGKGTRNQAETLKEHTLITSSDLMKLNTNQAIIFYAKENPFKANLIPWYQLSNSTIEKIVFKKQSELINFNKDYFYDIKILGVNI